MYRSFPASSRCILATLALAAGDTHYLLGKGYRKSIRPGLVPCADNTTSRTCDRDAAVRTGLTAEHQQVVASFIEGKQQVS